MDRPILEQHLSLAEKHVAQGEQLVARQRELAAKLGRNGHETAAASARDLLTQFEEIQELYVADRDRLKRELSEQISN